MKRIKEYHILNGDALKAQFPSQFASGEIIVVRECLVEGPTRSSDLSTFWKLRYEYMQNTYEETLNYHSKVQSEFERIFKIFPGSNVYLWFEYDLFCQLNFWFCNHLICFANLDGK